MYKFTNISLYQKPATTWNKSIFRHEPLRGWVVIVNKLWKRIVLKHGVKRTVCCFGSLKLLQPCGFITVQWRLNVVLWHLYILMWSVMESSSSSDLFLQVTEISRAGCLKELKCQISSWIPIRLALPPPYSPTFIH